MKIVVFGLSISSSWGNGHATLWRGLVKALTRRGCSVTFFERDTPYYAANRDLHDIEGGRLVLYPSWPDISAMARREIAAADACIVTSYCPDAIAASRLVLGKGHAVGVFYDLDTPVTLAALDAGEPVAYIGHRGLRDYDLVLSFTGGSALDRLQCRLGAPRVAALYGHADPEIYTRQPASGRSMAALSHIGTFAADRQQRLAELFVAPASRLPDQRFVIAGAQYPADFPWHPNIWFLHHLPPSGHPAFYSSSRMTLNVTREPMRRLGHCPSGRLFEASACACPVVTDAWSGLAEFYEPGREIIVAESSDEVLSALAMSDDELGRIGNAARERTLACHTSEHRAAQLLDLLQQVRAPLATGGEVLHA